MLKSKESLADKVEINFKMSEMELSLAGVRNVPFVWRIERNGLPLNFV